MFARTYKTGGHVEINGKTAKPSTEVKVGDIITLTFGSKTLKIEVLSLKEVIKKEEADSLYRQVQ
mgnify:CR=1 FL=1